MQWTLRTLRWIFAIAGTLMAFLVGWWLLERLIALDREIALTLASIIAGLVSVPLVAWASREQPSGTGVEPTGGAHLPDALPKTWNVPRRSRVFIGRDDTLKEMHRLLQRGSPAAVALHGAPGLGKTQLAVEYTHRFAPDYKLVWWVDAENGDLIGGQLAALASDINLPVLGTETPIAIKALHDYLRTHGRWLVVFDNATTDADLEPWIPQGPGHIVITSRSSNWGRIADDLAVPDFSRAESVAMLTTRLPRLTAADAGTLAEDLGDLPLALAQAAGVIAETWMPASEYLQALASKASDVLGDGRPADYPRSLLATVLLALEKLTSQDQAAGQLGVLSAMLGPEPIPQWLFTADDHRALPEPLAQTLTTRVALRRCLGRLASFGLVTVGEETLTMHRLTRAVIRNSLAVPDRNTWQTAVEALLVAGRPSTVDPTTWPQWSQLLPHLLAVEPAGTANPDMRRLACDAVRYLVARGDAHTALPMIEEFHRQWLGHDGPDEHTVLVAADLVAQTMWELGQYEPASRIEQDTLDRCRRVHGEDHPDTLESANNLALILLKLSQGVQAHQLLKDTLARRQRVLGEDDRETLASANNLAIVLHSLGQVGPDRQLVEKARELQEDVLVRQRRVLGEDHRDTLWTANNLATILRTLGQAGPDQDLVDRARRLHEGALAGRQRVLGEDHPDTLWSAYNLAVDLHELGQAEQARELHEDTLARRRRVLGEDHPDTVASTTRVAILQDAPLLAGQQAGTSATPDQASSDPRSAP